MHSYGDDGVDWLGIDDAGVYIGHWLRKWLRMDVRDVKEKFGTVRVYCSFGWNGVYSIYHPGYCWYPNWWPIKLDQKLRPLFDILNTVVVPIQQAAYAWRYKKAVQKWPHLYNEIVSCADWGELFEGTVPGYVHSDYWTKSE